MTTTDQIQIESAGTLQRNAIVSLLKAEKLPVEDLPPTLDHFFVATENNEVIGAIGLERYGESGLLRSAVVASSYQNKGVAARLVQELEGLATDLHIRKLYLLTETAPDYFERKGYERISRDQVPATIKSSTEFTSACPASAIVMRKTISHS